MVEDVLAGERDGDWVSVVQRYVISFNVQNGQCVIHKQIMNPTTTVQISVGRIHYFKCSGRNIIFPALGDILRCLHPCNCKQLKTI